LEFLPLLAGKKRGKKERKERQSRIEELEKQVEEKRESWGGEDGVWMRKDSKVSAGVGGGAARRARALLWAHLLRIDLVEQELKDGTSNVFG
jgi:translocation protein SEC63